VSDLPQELRYSEEHEWVRTSDDGTALIGITDFAQDQLGDIVYLSLPKVASAVTQFGRIGEVESVKSVSDLFSPVSGEVLEVNQDAMDHPERINDDPYGQGWLIKVRLGSADELEKLLSPSQYEKFLAAQEH
jgi:glycine cleavage system H protein